MSHPALEEKEAGDFEGTYSTVGPIVGPSHNGSAHIPAPHGEHLYDSPGLEGGGAGPDPAGSPALAPPTPEAEPGPDSSLNNHGNISVDLVHIYAQVSKPTKKKKKAAAAAVCGGEEEEQGKGDRGEEEGGRSVVEGKDEELEFSLQSETNVMGIGSETVASGRVSGPDVEVELDSGAGAAVYAVVRPSSNSWPSRTGEPASPALPPAGAPASSVLPPVEPHPLPQPRKGPPMKPRPYQRTVQEGSPPREELAPPGLPPGLPPGPPPGSSALARGGPSHPPPFPPPPPPAYSSVVLPALPPSRVPLPCPPATGAEGEHTYETAEEVVEQARRPHTTLPLALHTQSSLDLVPAPQVDVPVHGDGTTMTLFASRAGHTYEEVVQTEHQHSSLPAQLPAHLPARPAQLPARPAQLPAQSPARPTQLTAAVHKPKRSSKLPRLQPKTTPPPPPPALPSGSGMGAQRLSVGVKERGSPQRHSVHAVARAQQQPLLRKGGSLQRASSRGEALLPQTPAVQGSTS